MADATTTVANLREQVRHFVGERQWEPFHTPKNLAMALAVEAAELMEPFLWVEGPASAALMQDETQREAIADEVADVACLLLNLCNVLGLDLSEEIARKMVKNEAKYPAEKYRGRYQV